MAAVPDTIHPSVRLWRAVGYSGSLFDQHRLDSAANRDTTHAYARRRCSYFSIPDDPSRSDRKAAHAYYWRRSDGRRRLYLRLHQELAVVNDRWNAWSHQPKWERGRS